MTNDDNVARKATRAEQLKEANTKALEKLMAVAFIHSTKKAEYQQVAGNLKDEFLQGSDQHPDVNTGACITLSN